MIVLYSGTPGSGKSLHSAKEIRSRMQQPGKIIIGNFEINDKVIPKVKSKFIYVSNERLSPERLFMFSRRYSKHLGRQLKEDELWLIVDEAQLFFNSRNWQSFTSSGWLSFFSQHRKYGYKIVLIAQFDRMLDRQVRCLIEYEYKHRKVERFGNFGFLVSMFFGGQLYVVVECWYPMKERLGASFFIGSKKVFDIYDTFNHFDFLSSGRSGDLRGPTKNGMQKNKNKVDVKNGITRLDFSWGQQWNNNSGADTGEDVPGSVPAVVLDEA